jgi:predicted transposase/invertase (TIGR01784 family)
MDLNVKVNDMVINIEMQRNSSSVYPERSLFYWAKNYSQALNEGKGYETLPETIAINILEEPLFDGLKYHLEYHILEKVEHTRLTDRLCLHFFELSKLPEFTEGASELLLWLHLFNAKTDEDLSKISQIGGSFMAEVIEAYRSLTASDELKELERLMEKAGHDEASALSLARGQERIEIATKMKAKGKDVNEIVEFTGLTVEEILKL